MSASRTSPSDLPSHSIGPCLPRRFSPQGQLCMLKMAHATVNHWFLCGKRGSSDERLRVSAVQYKPTDEEKGRNLIPALTIRLSFNPYFVLPPSTPSFSLAA